MHKKSVRRKQHNTTTTTQANKQEGYSLYEHQYKKKYTLT